MCSFLLLNNITLYICTTTPLSKWIFHGHITVTTVSCHLSPWQPLPAMALASNVSNMSFTWEVSQTLMFSLNPSSIKPDYPRSKKQVWVLVKRSWAIPSTVAFLNLRSIPRSCQATQSGIVAYGANELELFSHLFCYSLFLAVLVSFLLSLSHTNAFLFSPPLCQGLEASKLFFGLLC